MKLIRTLLLGATIGALLLLTVGAGGASADPGPWHGYNRPANHVNVLPEDPGLTLLPEDPGLTLLPEDPGLTLLPEDPGLDQLPQDPGLE